MNRRMNHDHHDHGHAKSCCSTLGGPAADTAAQVKDPVCEMNDDPAKTQRHAWRRGVPFLQRRLPDQIPRPPGAL